MTSARPARPAARRLASRASRTTPRRCAARAIGSARLERAGRRPAAAAGRASSATRWRDNLALDAAVRARSQGVDLAPHGKTTMSPQLFRRQLDAGAWGLTFATVTQLRVGVAAGARRALIANQVLGDVDLDGIAGAAARSTPACASLFLVDSLAQLDADRGLASRAHAGSRAVRGAARDRRGRRTHRLPHARARRWRWRGACAPARRCAWSASSATKAWARRATREADAPYADALMDRVRDDRARLRRASSLFDSRRGAADGRRLGDLRPGGRRA